MNQDKTYESLMERMCSELEVLKDKPEETPLATLRALWFMAAGEPKSAQSAEVSEIPKLKPGQFIELEKLICRRLNGEPLAHITERQQFMGIELLAGQEALVPRKETEILGYAVTGLLKEMAETKDEVIVLDVCTGAGNLAVAYAIHEPKAKVYAADLSADAVSMALKNIKYLNLESRVGVFEGDLLMPFELPEFYGKVDILSCNPPYISSAKVDGMHSEISSHEPRLAFDGGPFGIAIIQKIIQQAPKFLKKGGWLAFEVGFGQGPAIVKRLSKNTDYSELRVATDADNETRAILVKVNK